MSPPLAWNLLYVFHARRLPTRPCESSKSSHMDLELSSGPEMLRRLSNARVMCYVLYAILELRNISWFGGKLFYSLAIGGHGKTAKYWVWHARGIHKTWVRRVMQCKNIEVASLVYLIWILTKLWFRNLSLGNWSVHKCLNGKTVITKMLFNKHSNYSDNSMYWLMCPCSIHGDML